MWLQELKMNLGYKMRFQQILIGACILALSEGSTLTDKYDKTNCGSNFFDVAVEMINKAKDCCPLCRTNKPADCEELLSEGVKKSGIYTIWPKSRISDEKSMEVYCDMQTDGGGWTVIQRRGDFKRPNDYFYQNWASYKLGFGDIERDFWLGNDKIFTLTNQKLYSVRFDLKDVEGTEKYALCDIFWIEDETRNYTLHIKDYSGDAGDSITSLNNMQFSTKDVDNDAHATAHCAQLYKGGWWYTACHGANLNGLYLRGKHDSYADGVNWYSFKGYHESLDTTEIKIRSKNFRKKL